MTNSPETRPRSVAPKRSNAARWFGYDIFISFALGPLPRGTQSYASDLARRLRELDFTVFFSEDEAPVGYQLDSTLHKALLRSRALVVIANREMLDDPRWVRVEVQEFRKACPRQPIIPISVGGVLQDGEISARVREWFPYEGNIWIDESTEAVSASLVSEGTINRLATAPRFWRANRRWRMTVNIVIAVLATLAVGLGIATKDARDSNQQLEISLRKETGLRLSAEAQATLSGARSGGFVLGLSKLLAAHRIAPHIDMQDAMMGLVSDFQRLEKIIETGHSVYAVVFGPNGTRFAASGSGDQTLRLWDARTGHPIGVPLKGHTGKVRSAAFSPNGTRLVSGSDDRTIRLWDVQSGHPIGVPWEGHTDNVVSIAFSHDGTRVVSGSDDETLRLWDVSTGKPIGLPLKGHEGSVTSVAFNHVAFNHKGTRVLSGGDDRTVRLWDVQSGQRIGVPWTGHTATVMSVAFSPNDAHAISGSWDQTVRLWDIQSGHRIGAPWIGHTGAVTNVAFSPNGMQVVSGSDDRTFRLWDVQSGHPIGAPWIGHTGRVWQVAFSPDGTRVLSGSADRTIRLWDVQPTHPIGAIGAPWIGHTGSVWQVAFNHKGTRVLSGSDDRTVRLWDVQSGQQIGVPWTGHKETVTSVAFSPDGTRAISGSWDQTVRLWDVQSGQQIGLPWTGHTATVWAVAFNSDGTRIVSGSDDRTVRLWDQSGHPIGTPLIGHKQDVSGVAFSPDDTQVVSGSSDRTLRMWDVKKDWFTLLCVKLTRNLSKREWREWVSQEIEYYEQCPGLPPPRDEPDNIQEKP